MRPRLEATSVSISSPRPPELAAFYARLLGVAVAASEPGWAQLRPEPGRLRMTLNFELDELHTPPTWPSVPGAQQPQAHLDVWVDDLDAAERWAHHCGATTHPHQPQTDVRVLLDPHGHPFCLFTAH
ncbi:VOC family protein [Propioniciclava sp.]|uniref:VOC family protein n=1 Tax=Propioniciclava sp. TaxID=2038686 RepID=UPI00262EEEAA|nr:VOC family protein [Propioniciclava sp.]